ncbi:MAG: acylphosphatase [Candidatus Nitrosocaldaceae archaeon]
MPFKIIIKGKVHDIGYRLFLLEEADSLCIDRFDARNVMIDNKETVVVLIDGSDEQLNNFVEFVKNNVPEYAKVEEINIESYDGRIRELNRFRASLDTQQLSKIVNVGINMLGKLDKIENKLDEGFTRVENKLDKIENKLDEGFTRVENKLDKIENKLDEGFKDLSSKVSKTNELLEDRFKNLEEEISKIKNALIRAGIDIS